MDATNEEDRSSDTALRPASRPSPRGLDSELALELRANVLAQLGVEARRLAPSEACGLLLGTRAPLEPASERERIEAWSAVRNTARRADRFALDPRDYALRARAARTAGLSVLGIYHSHPEGQSLPSAVDARGARALWGERTSWVYLILGRDEERAEHCRAWRLVGGRWRAVAWTLVPHDAAAPH